MENLEKIQSFAQEEIARAAGEAELEQIKIKYLGRRSQLTALLRSLKDLPSDERAKVGQAGNDLKKEITRLIESRQKQLKEGWEQKPDEEWVDISAPGRKKEIGHLHPLTLLAEELKDIFVALGFSVEEGPEMESEYYNFDALNFPKNHPARDMQDTFWLASANPGQRLLLRTHTSPVQIRYMQKHCPPLRVVALGRCFRRDASDASHDIQFHQIEGLMVDKNISVANLKAVLDQVFFAIFKDKIKVRLRPSFFPFTEPSFEVDISCFKCQGQGCRVCSASGWMEIMGAGMVHPEVLKNVGINPKIWQGFAFGMGYDRVAMLKYHIDDIRLFSGGDLRFIKQF